MSAEQPFPLRMIRAHEVALGARYDMIDAIRRGLSMFPEKTIPSNAGPTQIAEATFAYAVFLNKFADCASAPNPDECRRMAYEKYCAQFESIFS